MHSLILKKLLKEKNIRERKNNFSFLLRKEVFMNHFYPHKKTKTNEKTVITIRIDYSTLEEIDRLAYKTDISRNEFINQCINFALDNLLEKRTEND